VSGLAVDTFDLAINPLVFFLTLGHVTIPNIVSGIRCPLGWAEPVVSTAQVSSDNAQNPYCVSLSFCIDTAIDANADAISVSVTSK
jgi:hypothetical protein